MLVAIAAVALFACAFMLVLIKVPPYHGVIISRLGKPVRSRGHGLHPRIPFIERVADVVSTKKRNVTFKLNAEAGNRDVVPLNISAEYYPNPKLLLRFFSFTQEQIQAAIVERLKSLLSIAIRGHRNRDTVYDALRDIANGVQESFQQETIVSSGKTRTLENYYGVQLPAVMIADPELPAALAEAEIEKERMQEVNKARGLEMNKIRSMARLMMKDAEKHGQTLSYQEAVRRVQIQFEKVSESVNRFGLDKGTLDAIREGVALAFAGRKGGNE